MEREEIDVILAVIAEQFGERPPISGIEDITHDGKHLLCLGK